MDTKKSETSFRRLVTGVSNETGTTPYVNLDPSMLVAVAADGSKHSLAELLEVRVPLEAIHTNEKGTQGYFQGGSKANAGQTVDPKDPTKANGKEKRQPWKLSATFNVFVQPPAYIREKRNAAYQILQDEKEAAKSNGGAATVECNSFVTDE